jgi:uncharacterized RDD family membrane protein YckC
MVNAGPGERDPGLPERVLGRVVGSVVNPIVDQVDVDDVVERIDVNHLLERVDVDDVLDRIDVNRLLDRIDPDRLLDRVDPDRLLDRVDPDRLLDRVDPDRLLERIDVDRLLDRVDVNGIVERTELGAIIARSTTGVFTQLLDVVRTQIVLVDQVVQGVPARALGRSGRELPPAPGAADEPTETVPTSASERAIAVQGRPAGSVSRFLAFLADQFVIGVLFAVGAMLVSTAVEVVIGSTIEIDRARPWVIVGYLGWAFVYTSASLATAGRTIGKALLGVLVVRSDGSRLDGRRASLRTLVFPLSFLLLGVGFLIGLVRRDRRELQDLIADTAVVYAWDAKTALVRAEALGPEGV